MHPLKNFPPSTFCGIFCKLSAQLSANFFSANVPAWRNFSANFRQTFSDFFSEKNVIIAIFFGVNKLLAEISSRRCKSFSCLFHHHDIPWPRRLAAAVAAGTASTSHGLTVFTPASSSHSTNRHSQGIMPALRSLAFTPTSVPS